MTSNIGANALLEGINPDGTITDEATQEVNNLLKNYFRPEFLNRLDDIIMFKPLTKQNISKIVDLLFENLKKRLQEKQLDLNISQSAKEFIIQNGYDMIYGARPLKRYISHNVETLIAKQIIANDYNPGTILNLDANNNQLILKENN